VDEPAQAASQLQAVEGAVLIAETVRVKRSEGFLILLDRRQVGLVLRPGLYASVSQVALGILEKRASAASRGELFQQFTNLRSIDRGHVFTCLERFG
jgi:hypothetical protein